MFCKAAFIKRASVQICTLLKDAHMMQHEVKLD